MQTKEVRSRILLAQDQLEKGFHTIVIRNAIRSKVPPIKSWYVVIGSVEGSSGSICKEYCSTQYRRPLLLTNRERHSSTTRQESWIARFVSSASVCNEWSGQLLRPRFFFEGIAIMVNVNFAESDIFELTVHSRKAPTSSSRPYSSRESSQTLWVEMCRLRCSRCLPRR